MWIRTEKSSCQKQRSTSERKKRNLKNIGSEWEIGARDILRGRIDWNEDFSDTDFDRVFVIDGKRITIEDFGRMLEAYEGWRFKFQILDPCDDKK